MVAAKKDDSKEDKDIKEKFTRCQAPKGVNDILPHDHEFYTFIKKVIRHRCRQAGFRRITTPIFEHTEVFTRGIGEETDIVGKEMYTFEDKGGRSLTLKPESTAGVVRAYIEHGMVNWPQPVELYYIEPHFRYDKPQKGRYRQFWQFGLEVIGEKDPALDVQIIQLAKTVLEDCGVYALTKLRINNIGDFDSREKYSEALQNYFIGKERSLCEDCKRRVHTNPLRVLDCKEGDCQILAQLAPKSDGYISKESKEYHAQVLEYLEELKIDYTEDPTLVRGLDYYNQTVFEFAAVDNGGQQNAVCGGGRYDKLVEIMGGAPETPAIGFGMGLERVIELMKKEQIRVPSKDSLHVFVAQLGDAAKKKCLPLISELREHGIKTVGALGKGSMKAQMRLADKFRVPYALVLGITEVRDGTIILRDMTMGKQEIIKIEDVVEKVIEAIGKENLDTYSPGEISY